jgi:hypothetical protein
MKLDRQATSISGRNEAVPAGAGATTGLDPGYRTGVKVAVVTGTGQVAATTTIYPHEPQRRWDEAIAQLARLAREHQVELIAIGNGTASRETDRLGAEFIRLHPELELTEVVVSEGPFEAFRGPAGTRGGQQRPFKAFRGPPATCRATTRRTARADGLGQAEMVQSWKTVRLCRAHGWLLNPRLAMWIRLSLHASC